MYQEKAQGTRTSRYKRKAQEKGTGKQGYKVQGPKLRDPEFYRKLRTLSLEPLYLVPCPLSFEP
jgi:hypothetical protein